MLIAVVKVALWWGMKGREQEVERKVGNSSVFKRKKIHGNQHTSSNLSSQPNPESTKTPLTGASRSYKSRVSQILNFTTQSSKEATNRFVATHIPNHENP